MVTDFITGLTAARGAIFTLYIYVGKWRLGKFHAMSYYEEKF